MPKTCITEFDVAVTFRNGISRKTNRKSTMTMEADSEDEAAGTYLLRT
jgi:hypothetical protein